MMRQKVIRSLNQPFKLAAQLMYGSGLRVNECLLLRQQIIIVQKMHELDLAEGFGEVYMPNRLAEKYPQQARSVTWQFLFPSSTRSKDPRSDAIRRHHLYDGTLQRKIKEALVEAKIYKHASCHTFRHSFAT